jgi:hypothetical protein
MIHKFPLILIALLLFSSIAFAQPPNFPPEDECTGARVGGQAQQIPDLDGDGAIDLVNTHAVKMKYTVTIAGVTYWTQYGDVENNGSDGAVLFTVPYCGEGQIELLLCATASSGGNWYSNCKVGNLPQVSPMWYSSTRTWTLPGGRFFNFQNPLYGQSTGTVF